ncbi:hypothetical protein AF335_33040 [Streptomyces eurocidicus]|uniref:Uncharacterized protein n=1 Tax=Streptomyces eurocidicus TaxID=66423 RepID=A0A2N8NLY7_STREU|nr:hypothetical protein [Streptomyces eurocidicus]MBB5123236.1 hypothetical protein [Streptomyces eurocidicus]MBF6056173.1 hypothetical protein [Streptomyces eurocidicus]PNE29781.1 hypothetical protein AF335_33040 [Streptomyces eurocidicus]
MTAAATKASSAEKLAAKDAEAAEAPTHFEHRGVTFTVPHPLDMPIGLMDAEDEIEAVKLMLGKDQWEAYKRTGATLRDFQPFADKIAAAQGHDDAGN